MPSTKIDTSVLQAFLDAFNAHDVDAIMSFFTEDCVLDMPRGPGPGGRRLVGKEQVREGIQYRLDGTCRCAIAAIASRCSSTSCIASGSARSSLSSSCWREGSS